MQKILKIDTLRSNLLSSILKLDKWEKKIPSTENFNRLHLDVRKKKSEELTDLRRQEQVCLYKYVGELERTHPHFK